MRNLAKRLTIAVSVACLVVSAIPSGSIPSARASQASERTTRPTSAAEIPPSTDHRGYVAVTPVRIVDTRSGIGGVSTVRLSNGALSFTVAGRNGVPPLGVRAVTINLTATDTSTTSAGGYLTAYPCDAGPGTTSSVNFTSGVTVANNVIVPLDGEGSLCVYSYGSAHVVIDLNGWYTTASTFTAVTPRRVMDTRTGLGGVRTGRVTGDGPEFRLTGLTGVPATGVSAVSFNLTVAEPAVTGGGYVTVYPCGTRPNASNLNFVTGPAVANSVIVPVSSTGSVCFYVFGLSHLIVDMNGWFATDPGFNPLTPTRILDTRNTIGTNVVAPVDSTPLVLRVSGRGGVPASGAAAVSLNVTATNTYVNGGGYVTAYPCGSLPNASSLNFVTSQTVANTVIVPLSPSGDVCFSVYGRTDLIADVNGWYSTWSLADEHSSFTTVLPRTRVDRPDDLPEQTPKVKVLYAVPRFSTDAGRDLNGEISTWMFDLNEWFASQNGGYGLSFDTYDGALDIGYLPIDVDYDTWLSWFTPDNSARWPLYPLVQYIRDAGWNVTVPVPGAGAIDRAHSDLYYVVMEAPAGLYFKTGRSSGCRQVIEPTNYGAPVVGHAMLNEDLSPCANAPGAYPYNSSVREQAAWRGFGTGFDVITQYMRWLPSCSVPRTPRDGEMFTVPGTNLVERRGGFLRDILPWNDPLAVLTGTDGFPFGATVPPEMDPEHTTYFRISNGPLANQACNSDVAKHPLWSTIPLDGDRLLSSYRTSLDRPDDVSGRQVHAVYVVARDAVDRQFDTDGSIHRALVQFDDWLRSQSGGTGIRLDTYHGIVDVTYLALGKTAASYAVGRTCTGPPCPNETDLLSALTTAGVTDPSKQYIFFYEGGIQFGGRGLCGGSTYGQAAFINLAQATASTCEFLPWASDTLDTWSIGLLSGHELFHTLGAVCFSAPSYSWGHTSTIHDLMNGSVSGPGVRLDIGRDDYWGSGNSCDLSVHPLMTTTPRPDP